MQFVSSRPRQLFCALVILTAAWLDLAAQATPAATPRSAAISDVSYAVRFDRQTAAEGVLEVSMHFTVASKGDTAVILSLPAWTPGAYEVSNFARWVSDFSATAGGKALDWDKLDFDSWRIRPGGATQITVSFKFTCDSLDNAMTWQRADFAMFNGTNLFLYPEGRGFDWGASVSIETEPNWQIATGMKRTAPGKYQAQNYHDLVDMPFFVGEFMIDSAKIADRWVRLATYPAQSLTKGVRQAVWRVLSAVIPPEVAVFGEAPFADYTVMQIADPGYGGASGLEHQNSHVDLVFSGAVGDPFMPSLYAHEIFHAWNVKRLRPADMWPYDYSTVQPTPWLWVSEGITDYYADLALVRGGVMDSLGFFASTESKMQEVAAAPPVALEDASLSTWIHPTDGTAYIYYSKGALAGFLIDIAIRDASDNHSSLDDVMRRLYTETYKVKRGFTSEDWWGAVSAAAAEKSFDDFSRRYIDGREPLPFDSLLPLAGMRLAVDTIREPLLGIRTLVAEDGSIVIQSVMPGSAADEAGVKPGDVLVSVGSIKVSDQQFGEKFRAAFRGAEGKSLQIGVRRGDRLLALQGTVRIGERYESRIDADPKASPKAARIRAGILHGRVDR